MVAAGSLVTPGTEIPDGMLAMGAPCKVKGPLAGTPAERWVQMNPAGYQALAQRHRKGVQARVTPGPAGATSSLTGFEPFDGDTVNPSGEVAKQLDGRVIGDCVVRSVILPVQHEAARALVAPLLEAPGLVAVVHLGLAGGRARISLERVAVNVMDYSRPDAHGQVLRDVACAEGGPAAYFSTLPLRETLAALTAEGIPAAISNTAGTYLCNESSTRRSHALDLTGPSRSRPASSTCRSLPSMVTAHGLDEPSMDVAMMTRRSRSSCPCSAASRRRLIR